MEAVHSFDYYRRYMEKNHFGRNPLNHPRAYDTFLAPTWCPDDDPMHFTSPNLHEAASCVRRFINMPDYVWFHVRVYQSLLDMFYESVSQAEGEVLPFWCWCDGGDYTQEYHRHMIVVCPKHHAHKVDRPYFHAEPLSTAHALVYTLIRVSQTESDCTGYHPQFYLNLALPTEAGFVLALLWEHGLERYMDYVQEKVPEERFHWTMPPHALEIEKGQWKVSLKGFPNMPKNTVLPVPKDWIPTQEVTEQVLYLLHGRKLYFQREESLVNLQEDSWKLKQAEAGNVFDRLMPDDKWVPNARLQQALNTMRSLWTRYTMLRQEVERLFNKYENDASNFKRLELM